jgi:hypothetical protein
MNGNFLARIMALFFVSFFVFGALVLLTLPPLQTWAFASCPSNATFVCSFSLAVIQYWYLAALPIVVGFTYIANRLLPKSK